MRATFGRIALVAVVCVSLCGCKGGTSIFAKKKPSDSMGEAPKYAGSPTLPSAGQTPGTAPTNVNGTVAAGTPAYNSVDNKFANSAYQTQPAAYQQAVYPTTPYPPVTVTQNQSAGSGATNPPAASHPASGGLVDHSAATPAYGAANSAIPAYGSNASTTVQPQQGPYNPNYGSGSGVSTPPSYAAAPPSSPMSSTISQMSPPGTSATPATPQQDYRVADSRGAASAPVQSPAAPADGNSVVGDRYANVNASGWPADRYPNPADNPTGAAPANVPAPAGVAGDRYNMSSNAYPPNSPTNPPASSPYVQPGDTALPPAAGSGNSTPPARPDPGYLPGGTSRFSPQSNSLRPNPTHTQQAEPSRVVPASYETAASATTAPTTPPNATTTESYGTYQGTPAQPMDGNSNAAVQPGLFHGHSW